MWKSLRLPPRPFNIKSPHTEAWRYSFSNWGRSLLSTFVVTSFDGRRVLEFKKWLYTVFLKHEIDQWSSRVTRERLTFRELLYNLPHPQLPLNQSAFTSTYTFLNTPGYSLRLLFIDPRTYDIRSRLWPSAYIELPNNSLYSLTLISNTCFSFFSSFSFFRPSEPFLSLFFFFSYPATQTVYSEAATIGS